MSRSDSASALPSSQPRAAQPSTPDHQESEGGFWDVALSTGRRPPITRWTAFRALSSPTWKRTGMRVGVGSEVGLFDRKESLRFLHRLGEVSRRSARPKRKGAKVATSWSRRRSRGNRDLARQDSRRQEQMGDGDGSGGGFFARARATPPRPGRAKLPDPESRRVSGRRAAVQLSGRPAALLASRGARKWRERGQSRDEGRGGSSGAWSSSGWLYPTRRRALVAESRR